MRLKEILTGGSNELGVPMTEAQAGAFGLYLSELLKWNRKVNLTAIEDPEEVAVKHFLDSLALYRLLPEAAFAAADIGSGAGFPGLPLKIVRPDMRLTLVEPARKKAAFLRHISRHLGLKEVEVVEARAEALAESHAGRFDVVFSRAFKEPALLLPIAAPLIAMGGGVIVSVGPGTGKAPPEGWEIAREEEITLPGSNITRNLMNYVSRI